MGGIVGFSVGPPFYQSSEELKAGIETAVSLPFRGKTGFEGIAIGTDFLGVNATLSGLGNVEKVGASISSAFALKRRRRSSGPTPSTSSGV